MLDIKWIRENPDVLDLNQIKRGAAKVSSLIIGLDQENKKLTSDLQDLQQKRNLISKDLANVSKNSTEFEIKKKEVGQINLLIDSIKIKQEEVELKLKDILFSTPNILSSEVPSGKDESCNKILQQCGEIPKFSFQPKSHEILGKQLNMMDFEQTAKISGSRFVTLKGDLAKLERAIANYMLDIHIQEFGFEEVSPPLLVNRNAMFGTGQLPKFAEDSFVTTDDKWLISTSEIPLTNFAADRVFQVNELPLRMTAFTPCFRSEAGSAGKDTKGMIRLHQFNKVELVVVCDEESVEIEFANMLTASKEVLRRLEIPFQEVLLCSGDTGFSAMKTRDLEVWIPSQDCYREISSRSYFGDFQARRMRARYRTDSGSEKEIKYLHTMNGSGLAVGRTIVAILENYQQEDGSIVIPEVIRSYMSGQIKIENKGGL